MKYIFLLCLFCLPFPTGNSLSQTLEKHMTSHTPNEMGFYKVVLPTPMKLKKFKKWMLKNRKYHIVYYNKYRKVVSGATLNMVSRVGFLPGEKVTPNFLDTVKNNAEFIKDFMVSDFSKIKPYREHLAKEAALAAADEKARKVRAEKLAERKAKEKEIARKKRNLGVHCIEYAVKDCQNGKYTFIVSNSCELPLPIKYSFLVEYKRAYVGRISVPVNGTHVLNSCEAIDKSIFFLHNNNNLFTYVSDEELALHHVMEVYDDVYACNRCNQKGFTSCSYCNGKGILNRNGPMTCTHCSGKGGFTCGKCNGKGILGLD